LILRGEVFRIKAVELLTWVQKKYNADISKIELNKIIPDAIYDVPTIERQKEIMRMQVNQLYRAICELREVKHGADIEKQQRQKRFYGIFPERQALRNETSAVCTSIWRKTKKLLVYDDAVGLKSSPLTRLIWKYESVRDQVAVLVNHDDLSYQLESNNEGSRLFATPKELEKQISNDLLSKGIPVILTSDVSPVIATNS